MREREETRDPAAAEVEIEVGPVTEHRRQPPEGPAGWREAPEVPAVLADPRPDLETLHATSDVQHPALAAHRRILGSAVLLVKRLLLRLLTPSLEAQARHNSAATRLLAHYALRLERLERQVEVLSSRLADPDDGGPP